MIDQIFYSNLIIIVAFIILANIINAVDDSLLNNAKLHIFTGLWVLGTLISIPAFLLYNLWT